jgi:hypothetical protein
MNGEGRDDTITYRWILCWRNLYDGGSVIGVNKFGWFSTSGVQRLREDRKAMTSESYQGYVPWILQLELSWLLQLGLSWLLQLGLSWLLQLGLSWILQLGLSWILVRPVIEEVS